MLIILSGSSGVGKNTIINRIINDMDNVELMPTMTTREMRKGEEYGKPYMFTTKDQFENLIKNNGLIEYQIVHGNYYGTPKSVVIEKMKNNKILIKDIDVDGTQELVRYLDNVVTIFLKPKTKEQLIERLEGRGETRIEVRLARFDHEEKMSEKYKYILINDDFEETVQKIKEIIIKESNK